MSDWCARVKSKFYIDLHEHTLCAVLFLIVMAGLGRRELLDRKIQVAWVTMMLKVAAPFRVRLKFTSCIVLRWK